MFPFPSRNVQWMKQPRWFSVLKFHTLISQAGRHLTCHLPFHVIPPKPILEISVHLRTPWMYRIFGVMSFKHYCLLQILLCWYTQSVSEIKNSFDQYEVWSHCNVVPNSHQFRIFELRILNMLYKHRFKH